MLEKKSYIDGKTPTKTPKALATRSSGNTNLALVFASVQQISPCKKPHVKIIHSTKL